MGSDGDKLLKDNYRHLVDQILKERFSDGFPFTDIIVEPSVNFDGEDYFHTYIIFEGEWKKLDTRKIMGISTELWPDSKEMGYPGIPIQSFVEKSEWVAVNG